VSMCMVLLVREHVHGAFWCVSMCMVLFGA